MAREKISRRTMVIAVPGLALAGFGTSRGFGRSVETERSSVRPESVILEPDREFAASSHVHRPLPEATAKLPLSDVFVRDIVRQVGAHGSTVNIDIHRHSTLSVQTRRQCG
jgi:hypothetical protein